jgi:hypothetical protein
LHVWINTDLEGGIYRDRGAMPLGPKLNQLSGEDSKKSEAGVLKGEWTSDRIPEPAVKGEICSICIYSKREKSCRISEHWLQGRGL